jgi:hypothetical protein
VHTLCTHLEVNLFCSRESRPIFVCAPSVRSDRGWPRTAPVAKLGHHFGGYADDCNIYVAVTAPASPRTAQISNRTSTSRLLKTLKLRIVKVDRSSVSIMLQPTYARRWRQDREHRQRGSRL